MKRALAAILIILCLSPAVAGDHHDVSFSIGQSSYRWPEKGISVSYGINIGLTGRMELGLWGISEAVPSPFASNMLGMELSFSLLGPRSTASKAAGSGISMILSVGGFYRTDNGGAGPIVSISPLAVGTPISGRRERILKTGVGYDAVNGEVIVAFSLISFDWYLRGTWRDHSF